MHPALSVIFFTTASGAGYGLLAWAALSAIAGALPARVLLAALALALVLATAGLVSSLFHLGKPARAWRAYSQWRTSWLSREGAAATLTYVPALGLALALLPGALDGSGAGRVALSAAGLVAAGAAAACALATLACTAMIYASLKPIPAWSHRLVLPGYLLFGLAGGGFVLAAIAALGGAGPAPWVLVALAVAALAPWPLKARYWRDIDRTPLAQRRGDAVGLPGRAVHRFEGPTTEANFITKEMGFVVARRHARTLRMLAVALFAGVPLACLVLAASVGGPAWLVVASIAALAGAFVERWLFFAQARHMVTLYY